LAKAVW